MEREGYSLVTFSELFPDAERWQQLEAMRDRFVAETEADLAQGGEHVRVREGKEFVVRLHSYGVSVGIDDPWFAACASRRMLDVANTYLRMWSKLEYVDVWYSVPQSEDASRVSSQLWHRDYNDKHLLKAFLYLVDVDETMGPFQYIPGSHPGGPYADAWPWKPLGKNYPTEGELEQRIPASAVKAFIGTEGVTRVLQHVGFPPRRVLDDSPARAGDRDVRVAGLARVADGAELRLRGRARRSSTRSRGSRSARALDPLGWEDEGRAIQNAIADHVQPLVLARQQVSSPSISIEYGTELPSAGRTNGSGIMRRKKK